MNNNDDKKPSDSAKQRYSKKRSDVSAVVEGDEFLSLVDRVAAVLKPYAKVLTIVGALVFVGLVAWPLWQWRSEVAREKATAAFAAAVVASKARVVTSGEPSPGPRALGVAADLTFATHDERIKNADERWDKLTDEYASFGLAALAKFERAKLHLNGKRYAQAAEEFRVLSKAGLPQVLRASALENVGLALEAEATHIDDAEKRQAKLTEALAAFADMEKQLTKENTRVDFSLFHQARVNAAMGQVAPARKLFQRLLVEFPDSVLVSDARTRLSRLDPA